MSGSPLGASVELLHALLGVFFLLVPVLMTFGGAHRRRRGPLWAIAAAAVGCCGFVSGRALAEHWELDAAAFTVLPILTGLAPAAGVALLVQWLRPGTGQRAWPVLRLHEGQYLAGTLRVGRSGLRLEDAESWRVARADVVSVAAQEAAVVIQWRGPRDGGGSMRLLPVQDELPEPERERALAIAARIRRVLGLRAGADVSPPLLG